MHTTELDHLYAAHLASTVRTADRALGLAGADALVIGAGLPRLAYLDDLAYPFKANPQFQAWVPVADAPGSFVVHVPGRRPTLLFHAPLDYWHKPPAPPAGDWTREFEIQVIRAPEEARAHVPKGAAFLGEPFPGIDDWGFASLNPPALVDVLHYARAAKTPYELECLRVASRIGARAHEAARRAFLAGGSEYEIHLAYVAASGLREDQLPYPNIVALNEGCGVLHYLGASTQRPAQRRSFLIDAGAQCRGYASDITRTYAAAPGAYADLVAGVEALQQRLCARVAPGVDYPEIHLAAHVEVARLLVEHGLVRCSAEAAFECELTSVFFPHGVGHLLGLQVHDVGGYMASERGGTLARPARHPYLRLARRLEPGTVVTIEPGVYFIDLLLDAARADGRGRDIAWPVVEALKPFGGIRIEDDVVAVAGGHENLTRPAFQALAA